MNRFNAASSALLFSACRYCSTSSAAKATNNPRIADLLDVEFDEIGTGRFIAAGAGRAPYDGVQMILVCDVSERMLALKEHWHESNPAALQQSHDHNSNNSKKKRRRSGIAPIGPEDEESRMPAPISFSLFLETPQQQKSSSSTTTAKNSAAMCVTASCLSDSSLSIDGVAFLHSIADGLDRSVTGLITRRNLYQGPLLHQSQLAECALGTNFTPSPIALPRQKLKFPHKAGYHTKYNFVSRYNHNPVHTVQPVLYDSLFTWFSEMGVNDVFAQDVRKVALERMDEELRAWRREVVDLTRRKIYK